MRPINGKSNIISKIKSNFASLCKYYRSKNKLSTNDLGKKMGCSKSMVEAYESLGDPRGPSKSYETLSRLAGGLDLTVIGLLHILEGKHNEEGEESGVEKEILKKSKTLSPKCIADLLYLLDGAPDQVELNLELTANIAGNSHETMKNISTILSLPEDLRNNIFELAQTISKRLDK